MKEGVQVMFKTGDIVSLTFRNGYDKNGNPILETLDRVEVLGYSDDWLQVSFRNVNTPDGSVELEKLSFRIKKSDIL
ncbi:MAG: hypothetical protein V1709_11910 [Planctomycetota bacterium]